MPKAEIPYCTIFIVGLAITCHTLVLIGNLETANMFHGIGQSSSGWSDVGLNLAGSLDKELDDLMHETVSKLTGTLKTVIQVETDIDFVLGASAKATDKAVSALQATTKLVNTSVPLETKFIEEASARHPEFASLSDMNHLTKHPELASLLPDCEGPSCKEHGDRDSSMLLQSKVVLAAMQAESGEDEKSDDLDTVINNMLNDPKPNAENIKLMRSTLHKTIKTLVAKVGEGIHQLMTLVKPALLQIGKWLQTMGHKMQGTIEEMSLVIDKVQKLIDQVMAKLAGGGSKESKEDMLVQVFELFDVSGTGFVSKGDIHKVSILYGITPLQGKKGMDLFEKYDADKNGKIVRKEFDLMVDDESIPKAGTVILRSYSRKLAEIAGKVGKAKMRDEVAHSVVQYFTLVCAKSRVKTGWIAERMTNNSLPLEFFADVLRQFAHNSEEPGSNDVMDVGEIAIKEMWRLNSESVTKAMKKMADPKWWNSAGFDPSLQAKRVKQVSDWVVKAGGHAVKAELMQVVGGGGDADAVTVEELVAKLHDSVEVNSRKFEAQQRAEAAAQREELLSSETSAGLFQHVLGSAALVGKATDPDAARVVSGGIPAKPETLQFASWLATNATRVSHHFQDLCFDQSGSSSGPVDSLANQIKGMLAKTQNFLRLMMRYSTKENIEGLEGQMEKFIEHAADEVLHFVDAKFDVALKKLNSSEGGGMIVRGSLAESGQDISIQGMWKEVIKFTKEFKAILPTVIDDIKFAKNEVSGVASNMAAIFPVFKTKASPIFESVKSLYSTIWIAYYVLFVVLTLGVLYYGLWASGCFGKGEEPIEEEVEVLEPQSIKDRICGCLSCCCKACLACMDTCESSAICFWSMIILAEVIVLVIFVIALVLTIVGAIKAFMAAGCGEVYLINDNLICTEIMNGINYWLNTFWDSADSNMASMCMSSNLLTCQAISKQMMQSLIFTSAGGMAASVVTAQMIFETARLHERARWRRMADDKSLEFVDVSEKDVD